MNARTSASRSSWPRYEAYKPSGSGWLGELPAHWEVAPLRHAISRIEQGWSPLCDNQPAELDEWGVLKAGAVNGPTLDESEQKRLPPKLTPLPKYEIRAGDVLMSRANTRELLGSAVFVDNVRPRLMLCDKLYRLHTSRRGPMHPEFLVHFLRSHGGRAQLEVEATGTSGSMQNIGQDTVLKVHLPVPPMQEQSAVLRFLDRETARLDGLIQKRQRMIALLQEKRASLITHAVTRGLDDDAPLKDSGIEWLGQTPAHWEVKRLKYATTMIRSGKTPRGGAETYIDHGIPLIRSQNVQFDGLQLDDVVFIDDETDQDLRASRLFANDVLLNITGASIGRCCVFPGSIGKANVNQHVCAVRSKRTLLDSEFLAAYLSCEVAQCLIKAGENGTSREGLNFKQIGNFVLPLPPLDEQRAIALHLRQAVGEITNLEVGVSRSIATLTEYRASLITAAVTGQIDVRALAP